MRRKEMLDVSLANWSLEWSKLWCLHIFSLQDHYRNLGRRIYRSPSVPVAHQKTRPIQKSAGVSARRRVRKLGKVLLSYDRNDLFGSLLSKFKVRESNSFSLSDRRVRVIIGRVGRPSLLGYQSMAHPAAAAAVECAREAVRRTFQFFLAQIGSLLSALCQFLFSFPNFSFAGFFHASSFFQPFSVFLRRRRYSLVFFSLLYSKKGAKFLILSSFISLSYLQL